jgi:amino acid transporter
LGFTVLAHAQMPAYAGGELKTPRITTVFAMIGTVLVSGIILTIMAALAYHTFGWRFLGGMTYLFNRDPKAYPNIPPPFFFLYASMLTNNAIIVIFIGLAFVLAVFTGQFAPYVVSTRNLLAYSLDRILPNWLTEVNPRYHTPARVNALVAVIAVIILWVYVYGPANLFAFVYSAALLQAVVFMFTALSAILFAYRVPDVFASSPYNQRLGRIPLITILGIVSFIEYAYFAYVLATNSDIGANARTGIISVLVLFLIGIPVYVISYLVNRSRGVDVTLAFHELPPE